MIRWEINIEAMVDTNKFTIETWEKQPKTAVASCRNVETEIISHLNLQITFNGIASFMSVFMKSFLISDKFRDEPQ